MQKLIDGSTNSPNCSTAFDLAFEHLLKNITCIHITQPFQTKPQATPCNKG